VNDWISRDELLDCPWCGQVTRLHWIRAHYECASCHRPVLDCCDGEKAEAETAVQFSGKGLEKSTVPAKGGSGQTQEQAPKAQGCAK
jgi:hypothetical protein